MVENKYGISSTLSFGAKSVHPKILEALLVGREKLVNQLEKKAKNIAKDGLNHQVLIIGARGTGKTHMLSVLHHRIQPLIKNNEIKVAYFAEEEYGISDYLDFMIRILNAFIRWNKDDADFLREQISILQETPNSHQEDTIKRIINDYIADKPLLILAENFNDIIDSLKKTGQSKLRNWIQENERISIIATSQALSDDIGKEDKPFYGFFEEIDLKPLTLEESYLLLEKLAKLENKDDLIEHLKTKGKAQVKAINTLVKGNHRLLITFYEFLKSDILSNLSVLFIKTLNDLKPYYETYIRYQPPQQQKIIRFLALSKKPQKGVEISRECFIEQKSLSKQLSELTRKKLIEAIIDPTDKRNKLYDISEPLLRISIEIGEQKEGISALFIDFLALYYDQNELENQKTRFSNILKDCINPKEKKQYFFEVDARERALELQKSIVSSEISINYIEIKDLILADKFTEAKVLLDLVTDRNEIFYITSTVLETGLKNYPKAISNIIKAIEFNSNRENSFVVLGNLYLKLEEKENAIVSFKKAIEINPKNKKTSIHLGNLYYEKGKYEKAKYHYEEALSLDLEGEISLITIALNYVELKEYKKAKKIFEKELEKNREDPILFYFYAHTCYQLNLYDKAIFAIEKAVEIDSKEEAFQEFLFVIYTKNQNYKKATSVLEKAISITLNKTIHPQSIKDFANYVIGVLLYDKNLTIEKCIKLEKNILKDLKNPKELQIALLLIKTFRKVVLEGKKEALYKLPKEQREFFNEKIIAFRKTL